MWGDSAGASSPHDCRSRGDCGARQRGRIRWFFPPHDCRSRGDCGEAHGKLVTTEKDRLTIAAVAATAAQCSIVAV